jgi:type IV pilus assembly protein PilA
MRASPADFEREKQEIPMRIQDRLTKMKNKRGFTLVELMIVVAIIGVLAALAIYGVRKYLANAKTAEARTAVGRIAKDASSAWDRESMSVSIIPLGSTAGISHALCPQGNAVPGTPPAAAKYQTKPSDWIGGWACLRFSMDGPQYFSYSYTSVADTSFAAVANGDLNGDGNPSTFTMSGSIQSDPSTQERVVVVSPNITELNPEE